ncbi:hypothetical protein [Heyndrickxia acidicola]|uniref:Uncharacterized protein n=1 Tax=Heyndrickxia acidicola TaxID=209389 RepID=A0ABU6MMF9_9BACI|nr:hypothetical protein [Heyndrickxia acidicola]MED1205870.1 hypothetical protein [Heyndrickxia acidicola]
MEVQFKSNDTVLEISTDEGEAMICIFNTDDPEPQARCFHLDPNEIDLFIATLTFCKKKIEKERLADTNHSLT